MRCKKITVEPHCIMHTSFGGEGEAVALTRGKRELHINGHDRLLAREVRAGTKGRDRIAPN